jgi:hypothetical protein
MKKPAKRRFKLLRFDITHKRGPATALELKMRRLAEVRPKIIQILEMIVDDQQKRADQERFMS